MRRPAAGSPSPPAVLAAVLLVAAVAPVPGVEEAPTWSDLVVHAVGYGALAAALLRTGQARRWPRPAATAVAAAVLYGGLTELVQAVLPHRSASAADVVADAAGAVVLVAALAAGSRRRRAGGSPAADSRRARRPAGR